ncbi:MAG: DUF2029 domain-containing protein [Candidatus Riflebacteria bacterium]|nr:DUF2029 domain-containing protein [Candidatus Riflebacteria bacterium]
MRLTAIEIVLVALGIVLWTWSSIPPGSLERDWTAWHRAGDLWWKGRVAEIYPGSFDTRYPFPYPPYAINLFALFSIVPYRFAHGTAVLFSVAALGALVWCLGVAMPGRRGEYVTVSLVAIASAPWLSTLVVGQLAALYPLLIGAGLACWATDRRFLAGLLWGIVWVKPNIGVPFAICCLAARQWRALLGMSVSLAALLLSTLPMGLSVWHDAYAARLRAVRECPEAISKHQTLHAFFSTTLGPGISHRGVDLLWACAVVGLLAAMLVPWWRGVSAARLPRLVGVTVLFAVASNYYLWFYDGLLVLIPGAVWFLARDGYGSPALHALAGALLGATFIWQHLSLFWLQGGPALTGALLALWLVVESLDLWRAPADRTHGP